MEALVAQGELDYLFPFGFTKICIDKIAVVQRIMFIICSQLMRAFFTFSNLKVPSTTFFTIDKYSQQYIDRLQYTFQF
jgi:hypothetical protein